MGGVIFFQFRPGRGVDLIIQTCPIKRRHHVMITRADVFPRAKASLSSFFCFFGKVVHLCVHLSPEQFGRQEIVHPRRVWLMRLMNLGARRPAEDDGGRPRAEKLLTSAVSLSFYCCCQRFSPWFSRFSLHLLALFVFIHSFHFPRFHRLVLSCHLTWSTRNLFTAEDFIDGPRWTCHRPLSFSVVCRSQCNAHHGRPIADRVWARKMTFLLSYSPVHPAALRLSGFSSYE